MLTKVTIYVKVISLMISLLPLYLYSQNQNQVPNGSFEEVNDQYVFFNNKKNEIDSILLNHNGYIHMRNFATNANNYRNIFKHMNNLFVAFSNLLENWNVYSMASSSNYFHNSITMHYTIPTNSGNAPLLYNDYLILNHDFKCLRPL